MHESELGLVIWLIELIVLFIEDAFPDDASEIRRQLSADVADYMQQLDAKMVLSTAFDPNSEGETKGATGEQYRYDNIGTITDNIGIYTDKYLLITFSCFFNPSRCAVETLELAVRRVGNTPISAATHALVVWYTTVREQVIRTDGIDTLRLATDNLWATWETAFQETGIHGLNTIAKYHRVQHVAASVRYFGPYNLLTTENSEHAHKRFKAMWRKYVVRYY